MKKIMILLIITLGIISLTSCNGLKEGTTTTRWIPGEYAYDEYFEYDVYALSYFGKDARHYSIAHAFSFDDFFEGIEGTIEDEKGFCAVASTEEIAKQEYILTPGRYVGIEEQQEDDEPFEEKMTRLTTELSGLFEKSHELELNVREQLAKIGYKL